MNNALVYIFFILRITIRDSNPSMSLKVAYTAMHGVGTEWVEKAFAAFGIPAFVPVKEQVKPDPEFPTVAFPNPEEGKGALSLAIKTAQENNCYLILANDPDADRLAVAELTNEGPRIFTGNEIAALFADWVWSKYKSKDSSSKKPACMIASTVSSKFIASMAEKEGFTFVVGILTRNIIVC